MVTPDENRDRMEKELLRLQIQRLDPTNELAKKEGENKDEGCGVLLITGIVIIVALLIMSQCSNHFLFPGN